MMEWAKYSDMKDTLSAGDVIVATFLATESINRVICFCVIGPYGELIHGCNGNIIEIEPDYAFLLDKPDQFVVKYFV